MKDKGGNIKLISELKKLMLEDQELDQSIGHIDNLDNFGLIWPT